MLEKTEIKLFVLDTNVVLCDSKSIFAFKEHDVAIPIQVLIELDNHKNGSEIINYNAREFIRFIEKLDIRLLLNGGASIGKGFGKIRLIVNPEYEEDVAKNFAEKSMDHLIINVAYCLKKELDKKSKVVFVSRDVNLRMKAKAIGLDAEDYESDKISNFESLNQDIKRLNVASATIDSLFKDRKIDFKTKEKLDPNEFVILEANGSKKTALAVFKNNNLILIEKADLHPFGIKPKNAEQAFALHALLDKEITLVTLSGNAGTGKTIVSLASALEQLEGKKIYDGIFFTRNTVSVGGKEIGFLPGDTKDKISPYMQGMYDNLGVIKEINKNKINLITEYIDNKDISIEPISFIRGRSLIKKYFIVDEAQNLTQIEIKTIITRAGIGTKIILIGDLTQIDSPYLDERSNGLSYVMDKMRGQDFYAHINLVKGERSQMAEIAGKLL